MATGRRATLPVEIIDPETEAAFQKILCEIKETVPGLFRFLSRVEPPILETIMQFVFYSGTNYGMNLTKSQIESQIESLSGLTDE